MAADDPINLETGQWNIFTEGNENIIVEIDDYAAFAYFWIRNAEVKSHVWLFNQPLVGKLKFPNRDTSRPMEKDNIDWNEYYVPKSIAEISCHAGPQLDRWHIMCKDKVFAIISRDGSVGFSRYVINDTVDARRLVGDCSMTPIEAYRK